MQVGQVAVTGQNGLFGFPEIPLCGGKQSEGAFAEAGCGKTKTLIARALYLHREMHVTAERIALLTFTRKAAREISERRITELIRTLTENPSVAGYCCTQLTDIEQERNGIYNYDRTPKFDAEAISGCFSRKPDWSRY